MFDKKFEDLQLPTSRLVRRRRHLGRVYEQVTLIWSYYFQGNNTAPAVDVDRVADDF